MNHKIKQDLESAKKEFKNYKLDKSKIKLTNILKKGHENFEIYKYLLYISIMQKNVAESGYYYRKAISLDANNSDLLFNYGKFLIDIKNYYEAELVYKKLISLEENNIEVILNLTATLLYEKKYEEVKKIAEKHLTKNNIKLKINYASALVELFENKKAIDIIKSIELWSENLDALIVISNIYLKEKDYYSALIYLNNALIFDKKNIDILTKIIYCHKKINNHNLALNILDEIELTNSNKEKVLLAKAEIYFELNKYLSAKNTLKQVDGLTDYYSSMYLYLQFVDNAWDQKRIDLQLKNYKNIPQLTLALSRSGEFQKRNLENFVLEKQLKLNELSRLNKYNHHPKIRLGYFSSDLREHAVSYLIAELIELHDRTQFEVHAFSFDAGHIGDQMRPRLMNAFDHWHDVQNLSDLDVVKLARSLEIDIAINLNGHTQGARNDIFAYRAAPVQINYLGYPGTMGADYMDYILADRIVIPEENQRFYSEKVLYLSDCYQANDTKRPIANETPSREECGLPENGFVFACFNASYKITPEVFDSWMRILSAVEGSILWLLIEGEEGKKNLQQEAEKRGINKKRIRFMNRTETNKHIARQRLADLFLDTFNYNAGTTASDSLWCNLPLLTLRGETFSSSMAASLLTAIGLEELITSTSEEYEQKAIELGNDPEKIKKLKEKLLRNKSTYPLFDTARFTKNLEQVFMSVVKV